MIHDKLSEPGNICLAESCYIKPTKHCRDGGQNPDPAIVSICLQTVHLIVVSEGIVKLKNRLTEVGEAVHPDSVTSIK